MREDIDEMYEEYMNSLIEEQEETLTTKQNPSRSTHEADFARHLKWCDLIPSYRNATKNQKKKMKVKYKIDSSTTTASISATCETGSIPMTCSIVKDPNFFSLAPFTGVSPECLGCETEPNKKENNMGYELETEQRNHLKRRLTDLQYSKGEGFRTTFYMNAVKVKTLAELTAKLKSGEFTIRFPYVDEDGKLTYGMSYSLEAIELTDPKRDEKGYVAAKEALDTAATAAKDVILVLPLADGLKALQDFESKTFH